MQSRAFSGPYWRSGYMCSSFPTCPFLEVTSSCRRLQHPPSANQSLVLRINILYMNSAPNTVPGEKARCLFPQQSYGKFRGLFIYKWLISPATLHVSWICFMQWWQPMPSFGVFQILSPMWKCLEQGWGWGASSSLNLLPRPPHSSLVQTLQNHDSGNGVFIHMRDKAETQWNVLPRATCS